MVDMYLIEITLVNLTKLGLPETFILIA